MSQPSATAGTDQPPERDGILDVWRRNLSPLLNWIPRDAIRVDEYQDDGDLVIEAELPGVDPARDVDLTVESGSLRIAAHRQEESTTEERGYMRREIRSGSFTRVLRLPPGVTDDDIKASYKDGILQVRLPNPEPRPSKTIPIERT